MAGPFTIKPGDSHVFDTQAAPSPTILSIKNCDAHQRASIRMHAGNAAQTVELSDGAQTQVAGYWGGVKLGVNNMGWATVEVMTT